MLYDDRGGVVSRETAERSSARSGGDALESRAEGSLVSLLLRPGLVELGVHRRDVAYKLDVAELEAGDDLEKVGVGVDGLDLVHPDVCRIQPKQDNQLLSGLEPLPSDS